MHILILTGPPGAGKNTIAQLLAKKQKKCAVIDVDLVRWMILHPHKAPWEGEEGRKQQFLGVRNACVLVRNFIHEGYDVCILDVLSDETANVYNNELKQFKVNTVLLLPTYEEIIKRNTTRPPRLKKEEVKMLYNEQTKLTTYDEKIDNTTLSAEEIAERLLRYFQMHYD